MSTDAPPLPSEPSVPSAASVVRAFVRPSGCALCDELRKLLPADAEIHDVETLDGLVEFAHAGGGTTVPMLVVGNTVYLGREAIDYLARQEPRR